jgi:hypothetical protein
MNPTTGVRGISVVRSLNMRKDGRVRLYFSVCMTRGAARRRNRKFSIDRLGKAEAWRRAVRCRAEFERTATPRKNQYA